MNNGGGLVDPNPKTLLQGGKRNGTGPVRLQRLHQSDRLGSADTSEDVQGAINANNNINSGISLNKFGSAKKTADVMSIISGPQDSAGGVLANLKSVKLSAEEQEFIKEYRNLEELEREKGIKFF